MLFKKPVLLFVVCFGLSSAFVNGETNLRQSAKDIMILVDNRYTGDTQIQTGIMTLIDNQKNKRVRKFKEYRKKYGLDEKSISYILSPPEVQGTAFLSYEWKDHDRDDETWLYFPQLGKVKRLATTDRSGYFLGSDFTYADLAGMEVEDFDYVFAEDQGDDKNLLVIIATPKKEIAKKVIDETGYIKIKYWIDKRKMLRLKAQYWLKEGKRIKYYSAPVIEEIAGVWTAMKEQMVTTQGGKIQHASVFELQATQYNQPVKDEMFTIYALERVIVE